MKTTRRTIFVVIAAVIFLIFLAIYSKGGVQYSEKPAVPSATTGFPGDDLAFLDEVAPEDSDWELYRNERLGFSMKLPKQVELGEPWSQKHSPVKVFEDGKSNFVYVRRLYKYTKFSEQNTFTSLRNDSDERGWIIYFASVENEEELLNFIRQHFGSSCVVSEKKISSENIIDITVMPSSEKLLEECFVNFMHRIKFSPLKQKVALWGIGQDTHFIDVIPEAHSRKTFDFEMADSFQFE